MFFSSIKEINRLVRKVKYLLKSYYWEKVTFSRKTSSPGQLLGSPSHGLDKSYDVFKSKSSRVFLAKIKTLIKTKPDWRRKIPHMLLKILPLCFNSFKNQ